MRAHQETAITAALLELQKMSPVQKTWHMADQPGENIEVEVDPRLDKIYPTSKITAYIPVSAEDVVPASDSSIFTYNLPLYDHSPDKVSKNVHILKHATLEIFIGGFSIKPALRDTFRMSLIENAAHFYTNSITHKYGKSGTPMNFNYHSMNAFMQHEMTPSQREKYSLMIGNRPEYINWGSTIPKGKLELPLCFLHYAKDKRNEGIFLFNCGETPPIHIVAPKRHISNFIRMQMLEDPDDPNSWKTIPFQHRVLEKRPSSVGGGGLLIDHGVAPSLKGYFKILLPEHINFYKTRPYSVVGTHIIARDSPPIQLGQAYTFPCAGGDYVANSIDFLASSVDANEIGLSSHYGTYWVDDPNAISYNPFWRLELKYGEMVERDMDRYEIQHQEDFWNNWKEAITGIPDQVGYNRIYYSDINRNYTVPYSSPLPALNASIQFWLADTDPENRHAIASSLIQTENENDDVDDSESLRNLILNRKKSISNGLMNGGGSNSGVATSQPYYIIHLLINSYVIINFEHGKDVQIVTHFPQLGLADTTAISAGAGGGPTSITSGARLRHSALE